MASESEGLELLEDPLDAFDMDNDEEQEIPHVLSKSNRDMVSTRDRNEVVNVKPLYPEDEGNLVDEHDVLQSPSSGPHHGDEDSPEMDIQTNKTSSPRHYRRKRDASIMIKAPQAPKRFKSSYICFFTSKQSEIKKILGKKAGVIDVSKKSASMWKSLSEEERAYWDAVAAKDKERYMTEKASYTGPWQVPYKRAKKDPSAPKRPMSAFLLFSQGRRGKVKEIHPGMKNTEISRILGEQWRNCTDEERRLFVEEEKELRKLYKVALAEWKEKEGERQEEEMRRQKVQMEWHDKQQQQALQKVKLYNRSPQLRLQQDEQTQQQQEAQPYYNGQASQVYSYGQPSFMHTAYPAQGYPVYNQQGYPSQQYATPVFQQMHDKKKQPVVLGPNGMPLYSQFQQPQQPLHHHSAHLVSETYYGEQPPASTSALANPYDEGNNNPNLWGGSDCDAFEHLSSEPQPAG